MGWALVHIVSPGWMGSSGSGSLSAEDLYFNTGRAVYSLERPALIASAPVADRPMVALAMIAYYRNASSGSKKAVLDALGAQADGQRWQKVGALMFEGLAPATLHNRLEALGRGQKNTDPARILLLLDQGQASIPEEVLSLAGPSAASLYRAHQSMASVQRNAEGVNTILQGLRMPLTDAGYIPFATELGGPLPDELHSTGLPLEAAIIAQAMQRGRTPLMELQKRIPVYLAHAGDGAGAWRFQMAADANFLATRSGVLRSMDWLTLAGDYRKALEVYGKYPGDARSFSGDDNWTGFPMSRGVLRARAAGLMYLSGERKEALEKLEEITRSRAFDLETGYARLLQAQLIFDENTDLSRQIAEDLTYRAQEKSLYLLEYHATVLEGLALQRQGKDYLAWINFIKARGIVQSHLKSPPTRALALGTMLAGLKLNPGGSGWRNSAAELLTEERKTREHEGLLLLRDFLPVNHNPLLWKKALLENLASRKLVDDAVAQLALFLDEPVLHRPGESPGGGSGFEDSRFWSRTPILPVIEIARVPTQSATRSALNAALAKGSLIAFLPISDRFLVVSLSREESRVESLVVPIACLESVAGDCEAPGRRLREIVDGALTVVFPAGFLPPMALSRQPWRQNWLVAAPYMAPGTAKEVKTALEATGSNRGLPMPLTGCSESGMGGESLVPFDVGLRRSGTILLPPLTKKSPTQPVYLGRLICGRDELRLWDLDRFHVQSGLPQAYLYSSGTGAGQALTRIVARTGASLVETNEMRRDVVRALVEGNVTSGTAFRVIRPAL